MDSIFSLLHGYTGWDLFSCYSNITFFYHDYLSKSTTNRNKAAYFFQEAEKNQGRFYNSRLTVTDKIGAPPPAI